MKIMTKTGAFNKSPMSPREVADCSELAALMREKEFNLANGEKLDAGHYFLGEFADGVRGTDSVVSRCAVALDLDHAIKLTSNGKGVMAAVNSSMAGREGLVHTTASHSPAEPKLRLILTLSRSVSADEFRIVSRVLAGQIGMVAVDAASFKPAQISFWPTAPAGKSVYFNEYAGAPADVDVILAECKTLSEAPLAASEKREDVDRPSVRQCPTEKAWPIGAYCEHFTIDALISDGKLPYTEVGAERFCRDGADGRDSAVFPGGDTRFLHDFDIDSPAHGQNHAFDLMRIHMFGDLDANAAEGTSIGKMPSNAAMRNHAEAELFKIGITLTAASDEFDDLGNVSTIKRDHTDGVVEAFQAGIVEGHAAMRQLGFASEGDLVVRAAALTKVREAGIKFNKAEAKAAAAAGAKAQRASAKAAKAEAKAAKDSQLGSRSLESILSDAYIASGDELLDRLLCDYTGRMVVQRKDSGVGLYNSQAQPKALLSLSVLDFIDKVACGEVPALDQVIEPRSHVVHLCAAVVNVVTGRLAASEHNMALKKGYSPGDTISDLSQKQQPFQYTTNNKVVTIVNGGLSVKDSEVVNDRVAFSTLSAEFVPASEGKDLLQQLAEAASGDNSPAELYDMLVRVIGYVSQPARVEPVFIILQGATQTGKSSFLELIDTILGASATVLPDGFFRNGGGGDHMTEALAHKLAALKHELPTNVKFESGRLKEQGGGGSMHINPKGRAAYTAPNTAIMIAATNTGFRVTETTAAMARRCVVIPFSKKEDRDEALGEKLASAMRDPAAVSLIFSNALRRYAELLKDGRTLVQASRKLSNAAEVALRSGNAIASFCDQYLVADDRHILTASAAAELWRHVEAEGGSRSVKPPQGLTTSLEDILGKRRKLGTKDRVLGWKYRPATEEEVTAYENK